MPIANVDDLASRLIDILKSNNPNITTKIGSVVRDGFILPASTALSWDSTLLAFTQSLQSLSLMSDLLTNTDFQTYVAEALGISVADVSTVISNAIDRTGKDYGLTRKTATSAYGTVYFYTTVIPASDTTIPPVTITTNSGVAYSSSDTVVLPVNGISAYYDPVLAAYSIPVAVTAAVTGISSRVSANELVNASGLPANFSVTNKYAIETGNNLETDAEYISRIQTAIQGVSQQTSAGIKTLITKNLDVREVLVVDAQSPYQIRNNGKGGVVDIYVMDSYPIQDTQTMTYGGSTVFSSQPVWDILSVTSVEGGSPVTYVEGVDYELVADTNPLTQNSVRAADHIRWISNGAYPSSTYTVSYVYNQMLHDVQDLVTTAEYLPLMGDVANSVLTRQGTRIDVEIGFQVVTLSRYTRSTVITAATAAVQSLVDSLGFGDYVSQSDVIAAIESVTGVDYVRTTPTAFNRVGGAITNTLTSGVYEYLRASTITLS